MTYWDFVKSEARLAPIFFAVFIVVGVFMDMVVWQDPVRWAERLGVSVIMTIIFVLWSARRKMKSSQ
ncbi:hypothetical protein [Pararhodobacter sp.]|uniref:hypothetical protein n=1 Tax=Pararhodobacter sp. TaxID=2127056 RepID=UPI002AFF71E4|nr:hypothetical protein [Pararhodobacter sp.]